MSSDNDKPKKKLLIKILSVYIFLLVFTIVIMSSIILENQADLIIDNSFYKAKNNIFMVMSSLKKQIDISSKYHGNQSKYLYTEINDLLTSIKMDYIIFSDEGLPLYPPDSKIKINKINIKEGRRALTIETFEGVIIHSDANPDSLIINFYIPLSSFSLKNEILMIEYNIDYIENIFSNLKIQIIILIIGIIILFILFALVIYYNVVHPILTIFEISKKISSGNYSVRINSKRDDELGFLSNAFDNMTESIEKNTKTLKAQILEIKKSKKVIDDMVLVDELTNLFNKRALTLELEMQYRRARKNLEPLALILVDIDHFKKFNNTYGHLTGDIVLKKVSFTFSQACRDMDFCARYGGEELCVLAPACAINDLSTLMKKIRKSIEDLEIETSYGILKVTVSVGGVSFDKKLLSKINNSDAMIGFAEIALKKAKDKGRNRVCIG